VLRPALDAIEKIAGDFIDSSNSEAFSGFVDHSLAGRLDEIGLEPVTGEAETLAQLRPTLVKVQGLYGSDQDVRKKIIELADKYLADADSVPSDLGAAALEIKARYGGRAEYDGFRKAYLGSSSESMKTNLLNAMRFTDSSIIKQQLDWSLTDAVPAGDAWNSLYVFANVLDDHSVLYQWLDKNLDALVAKLPPVRRPYLPAFTASTCNRANLDRLIAFYQPRDDIYRPYLVKSVEKIENCIARKQREGAALDAFLRRYQEH
jgi:alanyl aminopeptidase